MASFQKIQELLLPCLKEKIINDKEFSVLYQAYAPQNFPLQHSAYEKFSLKKKILPNAKLIFPSIKEISHYLLKHQEFRPSSSALMELSVMEPKASVLS